MKQNTEGRMERSSNSPLKDIVVTAPGYSTWGWNNQNWVERIMRTDK